MKTFKSILYLFITMFKIGLFTFGGGYAMVALIERELVEKKSWLTHDEFLDVVAIAESTPGPIAVNSATYIGYKRNGVIGSIFSTLGVVLPSFIITFIISLFFDKFLQLEYVGYAFKGIQAGVVFLILSAGIKMFLKLKKTVYNYVCFGLTFGCLLTFFFLSVAFSSVYYILIGGFVGVMIYVIGLMVKDAKNKDKGEE